MTLPRLLLALTIVVPLCVALFLTAKYFILAPRTLVLSVDNSADRELFESVDAILKKHNVRVQLSVRQHDDQATALKEFSARKADLAIVRTDYTFPAQARSIVILRNCPIVILVSSDKTEMPALVDKPMAMLDSSPENMSTLKSVFSFWDFRAPNFQAFKDINSALAALKDKRVGSIAAVMKEASVPRLVLEREIRAANTPIALFSFPDLSAFTEANPGLIEHKFEAGGLVIRPKIPAEEAKTISFEERLVAHESIGRDDIAALTEALFKYRVEISQRSRLINSIKTIDNDYVTSSLFPVHNGALDYFRREQMNFYERYNDIIWLVIFYGGSVLSGFYWLVQTFVTRRKTDRKDFMSDVSEIVSNAGAASTTQDLQRLECEMADLMRVILTEARSRHLSRTDIGAATLALTMARSIIDAKYRILPAHDRDIDHPV